MPEPMPGHQHKYGIKIVYGHPKDRGAGVEVWTCECGQSREIARAVGVYYAFDDKGNKVMDVGARIHG